MKRSIGDFDVAWGENGIFIGARLKNSPKHQYWFRVSQGRLHVDPSILFGDVSTGEPDGDKWRFVDAAREAAEEYLRHESRASPTVLQGRGKLPEC
jgi:hypothetical protein